ncbi:hypothetical protein [Streptomyces sp. NPDC059881]|uniref:hypothetical protein n=1 Tax=Streptomyces sp. NPDC059881 TaxID=3346986 RepID=UPI003661D30E
MRDSSARSQHLTRSHLAVGPLTELDVVLSHPRPGLRRWVFSTLPLRMGREIYTELHHDGCTVLAVNLSWKALRADDAADPAGNGILVDTEVVGASCRDALALAHELARHLGVDSSVNVTATITTTEPTHLTPVITEYGGSFRSIPDHAHRPRRIQPVTALISPADEDDHLRASAQETFTDLMHQFGITAYL